MSWTVASLAVLAAALAWLAPIAQPAAFHHYADQRALLGLPHFWNVVTNLPFLVVGLMGLALRTSAAWQAVFLGSALVAFGSSYYHLVPNDDTLVWDRIPIAISFAGFFAALIEEHTGKRVLIACLVAAIAAVFWWRYSGDLSAWVFVQAGTMLAAALIVWLVPGRQPHRRFIIYALVCYGVAKLVEFADHEVMAVTGGAMSGHALKHLAAAAGVWCFYRMLRLRQPTG
jgi:hypothetical protein